MSVDYRVWLELLGPNSYANVAPDTLRVAISRERFEAVESLRPGRADVILDNAAGTYSPGNPASPYASRLRPGIRLRVEAVQSATTYRLFEGTVDTWVVSPELARQTVQVTARDLLRVVGVRRITPAMMVNVNARSAYLGLFAAASVSQVAVDSMSDIIPFAWFRDAPVLAAVQDVMQFHAAVAYVDPRSGIAIRDRYYATLSSVVGSYSQFWDLRVRTADHLLVNGMRVEAQPRRVALSVQTVAWLTGSPPSIPASSWWGFELAYLDPATMERRTPATSVTITKSADWLLNTSPDGTGIDRTATGSLSATIGGVSVVGTLFNGSADTVFVTKLQARGFPLQRQPEVLVEARDSSSQAIYGRYEQTIASDFIMDPAWATDLSRFTLIRYADPTPEITMSLKNVYPDILRLDFSAHLVHVIHTPSGVNSAHEIVGIEHDISMERGGPEHVATYLLRALRSLAWCVLDHPTAGATDGSRRVGF